MKLNVLSFALLVVLLAFSEQNLAVFSQTQQDVMSPSVKIGGQVRYRSELDLRFFDMNEKALFFNMLRTRLNADVTITPNVNAFVQFQDSRNFGEENGASWRGTLDGTADNLDLHQGWIELNGLIADDLTVRVGRMQFSTNSERIIGNLDWHNVGRSYDGAWASYKLDDWSARAFAFSLGSNELIMTSAAEQTPKVLTGFELNVPYIPEGNVYVYYDKNNKPITGAGLPSSKPALSRYTTGVFTKSDAAGLVWEFEAALQMGNMDTLPSPSSTTQHDISAWLVSAYAGYKTADFTIGGGIDAFSGDDPATDTYEGFDHLFFTLHKFYGFMDFFPITILPNGGLRQGIEGNGKGLLMPNIKASWNPNNNWKLDATIMMFSTLEPYSFGGNDLHNIGSEIDLLATYKISKSVSTQFGSSIFLPGEILEKTNPAKGMGTDLSYWGYVMITVNF